MEMYFNEELELARINNIKIKHAMSVFENATFFFV
jgi:hypothetical protein